MLKVHRIFVSWQGKLSRALLVASQPGVIIGTTSRGIFIRLDTDWIVFLSYERFHGPLTLNLSGELSILQGVKVNQKVMTEGGKIQILPTGVEVDFSNAESWEAPYLPELMLAAGDRAGALKKVAGLILSQNKEPGLYLVLNDLLGLEMGGLQPLPRPFERVDCIRLMQLLKTGDLDGILAALTPLLGLGAGLTPAGDDMLLGLLLAYHRWGSALRPSFDVAKLSDLLKRAASQKTTLLSANLIACASQGQADERLISALDGLLTGDPAPEQCARSLSSWGSSSGCDALVGMTLAILSAQP